MKITDKKSIFDQAKADNKVHAGRKMEKLPDNMLEDVAGGYVEDLKEVYSYNYWIECPYCGSSAKKIGMGTLKMDDNMHTVEYKCTCGQSFVVDGDSGDIYGKKYWVDACKKFGYDYPFQD